MSLRRIIFRNTAIQVLGKVSGIVLSIAVVGLVLRYLGPIGFGKYTGAMAFLQIFGILMDAGLYIILLKTLATAESQHVINNIFTLRIVSGVIFLGSAPAMAWIIGRANPFYSNEVIAAIALATLFYFCISMNQLFSAVFQNALRTHWIAVGEILGKIMLLCATLIAIIFRGGLLAIIVTIVVSAAMNLGVNIWASRRYITLRLAWDVNVIRNIVKQTWPIALSIIFTTIYFKGDSVLLTFFVSSEEVGWYGAPYKLLEVLITFPAMFAGLALPVLTNAWHARDNARFSHALQLSFDGISLVVLPMVVGTFFFAPEIIILAAGPQFLPAIPLLRTLIFAAGAIFYGTFFGYLVVALNRQRQMMWGYGFVAVSALIGYLFFIPRYGLFGAAWMTVYSEITVALIALVMTLYTARVRLHFGRFGRAGIAASLMGLVFWVARFASFNAYSVTTQSMLRLACFIPIGVMTYMVVLFSLRGFSWKEIKILISKTS